MKDRNAKMISSLPDNNNLKFKMHEEFLSISNDVLSLHVN